MSSNVCMQHFCRVIVDIQNNIHFLFLIVFCKNSPQNSVSVIDWVLLSRQIIGILETIYHILCFSAHNFMKSLLPCNANQFTGFYMIGILDLHECLLLRMSEKVLFGISKYTDWFVSHVSWLYFFYGIIVFCVTFFWEKILPFPRYRYFYIEVSILQAVYVNFYVFFRKNGNS